MLDQAGQFLFRTRNAIFPVVLGALLFLVPVLFPHAGWDSAIGAWLLWPGLLLIVIGQGLRVVTIGLEYIKRGGMKGKMFARTLITGGMFAHCRNPMYVGNFLIVFGLLLVAGHPIAITLGGVFFAFSYIAIVRSEERYLAIRFDEEYAEYCAHVPRWLVKPRGLLRMIRTESFDWPTVVVKEYGTLFVTVMLTTGLLAWKTWLRGGWDAIAPAAPIYGIVGGLAIAAYLTARFLKKSGRLTARLSAAAPLGMLDRTRVRIDEIDAALLALLNQRAEQVSAVFEYKRQREIPVFDRGRTDEIMRRLRQLNQGPLRDDQVEHLFSLLLRFYAFEYEPDSVPADEADPVCEPVEVFAGVPTGEPS